VRTHNNRRLYLGFSLYIKGYSFVRAARRKRKMHLEQMKKEIESLVIEKGFYNKPEDIPKKLLFAFVELGEASDAWKKGETEEIIAEELIDVIFYILDASRLACPTVNMDDMFKKKLDKNRNRPHQYGEGHRKK
jgi:NTP pyrophosphatase (non-canonical NTP hydrolase)